MQFQIEGRSLLYALQRAIEEGMVERVAVNGHPTYRIARGFFTQKLKETLIDFIERTDLDDLIISSGDDDSFNYVILQMGRMKYSGAAARSLEEAVEIYDKFIKEAGVRDEILKDSFGFVIFCNIPQLSEFYRFYLMDIFNAWHRALREGYLSHRSYLRKKMLLIQKIVKTLKQTNGIAMPKECIDEKRLDHKEPWTIMDVYRYHPRGRQPEFWEELLNDIDRNVEISKLEGND